MIKEAIAKVVRGNNLTESEMEKTMDEIMSGKATPAQIGAFVTALRLKGETVDEITGAARAMRAKAIKICLKDHLVNIDRDEINVEEETILDTCGTGGDATKRLMLFLHAESTLWSAFGYNNYCNSTTTGSGQSNVCLSNIIEAF